MFRIVFGSTLKERAQEYEIKRLTTQLGERSEQLIAAQGHSESCEADYRSCAKENAKLRQFANSHRQALQEVRAIAVDALNKVFS